MQIINIAEKKAENSSFVSLFDKMFGDLLSESFFILEHNRDNAGAGLE